MKQFKRATCVAFISIFFAIISTVILAIPTQISYQGKLTDATGTPINGDVVVKFEILGDSNAVLWTETYGAAGSIAKVTVTYGHFNIKLGQYTTLDSTLFDNNNLELRIPKIKKTIDKANDHNLIFSSYFKGHKATIKNTTKNTNPKFLFVEICILEFDVIINLICETIHAVNQCS